MGAIFQTNVIKSENLTDTINELKKNKFKIYGATIDASKNIYEVDYKKVAVVIGNESNGISKQILDILDEKITIPMNR